MMKKNPDKQRTRSVRTGAAPCLHIAKLGLVSRDYGFRYPNGYRDFSHVLPNVLKLLDREGCDTVVLPLFSIIPRASYNPIDAFNGLESIQAVFLEEFRDGIKQKAGRYVVYHRTSKGWGEYEFDQKFGKLKEMTQQDIDDFVRNELPKRVLGNCCVLLCGETNGVKYSRRVKRVEDAFSLRKAIPPEVTVVLNPVHDRMIRFEMKLKRRFLSKAGRWVVSVWNKGKKDKTGKVRDGIGPAWDAFHNGRQKEIRAISNQLEIEVGVLDIRKANALSGEGS